MRDVVEILEEKIMLWLCDHPGATVDEIALNLGWITDAEFMAAMDSLQNDGVIRSTNDKPFPKWYVMAP